MPILIQFIILLAVAGTVVYLFNRLWPMDARFKLVINAVVGLALFILTLFFVSAFFGLGWFPHGARGLC